MERCQSGRMGLIRNQVYGSPVPWVRIPPSPPENEKAPLWGLFVFSPRGYGFRTLFDASSGAAAFAVAKRLSHLLSTPPVSFLFWPGGSGISNPVRPTRPRSCHLARQRRRRNSTERYISLDNSAPEIVGRNGRLKICSEPD
jgi:hypothetical protein